MMLTLASQLLWIAQDYPEYSESLDPIIASVISQNSRNVKTASKIKDIMGGTTIFGIKTVVADRIDRQLSLYDLDAYAATLSFKGKEVTLLISARQKQGRERLSNFACNYIAQEVASDLVKSLAYKAEGSGSYSNFTHSVLIRITQRLP